MEESKAPRKPTPEDFGMTQSEYTQARAELRDPISVPDPISPWWIAGWVAFGLGVLLDWSPAVLLVMGCIAIATAMDYVGRKTREKDAMANRAAVLQRIRPYEQAISAYQQDLLCHNLAHERYWKSLRGAELERQLGAVYRKLNYTVTPTKATGDEGIDLVLRRDGRTIIVQCKGHHKPIGVGAARDLYGTFMHSGADRAVLACPAGFTEGVRNFVKGKPIDLLAAPQLAAMAEQASKEPTHVVATG
jgi:hypothetical protein